MFSGRVLRQARRLIGRTHGQRILGDENPARSFLQTFDDSKLEAWDQMDEGEDNMCSRNYCATRRDSQIVRDCT